MSHKDDSETLRKRDIEVFKYEVLESLINRIGNTLWISGSAALLGKAAGGYELPFALIGAGIAFGAKPYGFVEEIKIIFGYQSVKKSEKSLYSKLKKYFTDDKKLESESRSDHQ